MSYSGRDRDAPRHEERPRLAGSSVAGWIKRGAGSLSTGYTSTTSEPAPILLKTKMGGPAPHAGGSFWTEEDADYRALRQWIVEDAKDN